MKDLVNFSKDYSGKAGPSMLHYVNTNTGVVMQKHTTLQLDCNPQNITPTDVAGKNVAPWKGWEDKSHIDEIQQTI